MCSRNEHGPPLVSQAAESGQWLHRLQSLGGGLDDGLEAMCVTIDLTQHPDPGVEDHARSIIKASFSQFG